LVLSLAVWLANVLFMPLGFIYSQGRYLFPVTAPIAFFMVGGWARWIPTHRHRHFASGVVLLFVALDFIANLALWPFFYMGFYG
jgi:hypothetical protein